MKTIVHCRTTWAALSLPPVGWFIQYWNGGMLPVSVQTWGPLAVAIGVIMFRRATTESCRFCGYKG